MTVVSSTISASFKPRDHSYEHKIQNIMSWIMNWIKPGVEFWNNFLGSKLHWIQWECFDHMKWYKNQLNTVVHLIGDPEIVMAIQFWFVIFWALLSEALHPTGFLFFVYFSLSHHICIVSYGNVEDWQSLDRCSPIPQWSMFRATWYWVISTMGRCGSQLIWRTH